MKNLSKTLQFLTLAFSLSIFISCGAKKMTLDEIKTFPNGVEGVKLPELNSRINTSENLVGLDVQEKLGKFNSKTFTLSEGTTTDAVQKFYDEELKTKGFERTSLTKSSDSHIIYFERKGVFSSEKIAVVFTGIENYETKKFYPFLTVFVSQ